MYLHPVLRGVSFWGATSRSGPAGPGLDAVHKTRCVCATARRAGRGRGGTVVEVHSGGDPKKEESRGSPHGGLLVLNCRTMKTEQSSARHRPGILAPPPKCGLRVCIRDAHDSIPRTIEARAKSVPLVNNLNGTRWSRTLYRRNR